MSMERIAPEDLSRDEVRRLLASLQQRFAKHPDVVAVGFGRSLKDGEVDEHRRLAVRLWVSRKKAEGRVPTTRCLPATVAVRLRRGKGYVEVVLPTDVAATEHIAETASTLPGSSTSSSCLRWTDDEGQTRHGLITCAHGFHKEDVRNGEDVVVAGENDSLLNARLAWRSPLSRRVDVAVLEADSGDLEFWAGTLAPDVLVSTEQELNTIAAFDDPGTTLSTPAGTELRYLSFTPGPMRLAPGIPPLRNVVEALAPWRNTFAPGTSGALWTWRDEYTAIQVAASSPDFRLGYAVSLHSSLAEVYTALRATDLAVVGLPV